MMFLFSSYYNLSKATHTHTHTRPSPIFTQLKTPLINGPRLKNNSLIHKKKIKKTQTRCSRHSS